MAEIKSTATDRLISTDFLMNFFKECEAAIDFYKAENAREKAENERFENSYQKWNYYLLTSSCSYTIYYTNGRDVKYERTADFDNIVKHQAASIKSIYAHFNASYHRYNQGTMSEAIRASVSVFVYPHRLDYSRNIDPEDKNIQQCFDEFERGLSSLPPKNDRIIKQKELIQMKVGYAMGLVPAIILVTASAFVPMLHPFYQKFFWVFPLIILLLGFVFGIFLGAMMLDRSYRVLIPKKYAGYNANTRSSYYNDDLNKFNSECDIMIGEMAGSESERRYITETEKKFSKLILPLLGAVAVLSLIMFFVTR